MEQFKTLAKVQKALVFLTYFLFPVLFFPVFTNFFAVPKLVLLAILAGLNLLIIAARIVLEKKISLHTSRFDSPLILLMLSYLLSVVLVSPNKVEALLDPSRGAALIVVMVLLVLTLPKERQLAGKASLIGLVVLFLATVTSYFGVLGFLPKTLAFVNTKGFNLLGNILHQALYAGFFLGLAFEQLRENDAKKQPAGNSGMLNLLFFVSLLTTVLSLYVIFKDVKPVLFPLKENWQISVDVLKNPKNALFGVGPANYVALYTQSKPFTVNQMPSYWNVNLDYSRSAVLHILSEVGLLGIIALGLLLTQLYRAARKHELRLAMLVLLIWTFIFPLSQVYFFLLFLSVYLLREEKSVRELDLKELDLFAYATATAIVVMVIAASYFYGRGVYADYLVSRSSYAAQSNQIQNVYDYQTKAIQANPYSETARKAFIQTNMAIASSIAQKKKPTDADRQQYSQLVQQAITNARDTVTLNPQQSLNWASLATVYQTLLGQAEGASEWTIASYQRAIALDPKNPIYYFSLGSVFYSLNNFEEATRFFEQAISLKGDIPNYYYNLAWSAYRQENYPKAVNALETAMQFTKKGTNDYKRVKAELAEFKTKLPQETAQPSATETTPETLSQPTSIPTGQPTIELPKESAPPEVSATPKAEEK